MAIALTQADMLAIAREDFDFLNNKGAKFYAAEDYENAIEYYRLAAAMGCVHSISNLGYCYMYARSIVKNIPLAMAYFKIAAQQDNIDAQYKLGSIYEKGTDGVEKDEEMAAYYYTMAVQTIYDSCEEEPERYPSLFLSVAKVRMPGGILMCDLKAAYQSLQIACRGYELEQAQGIPYHSSQLEEARRLLNDPCFDILGETEEETEEKTAE